MKVDLVRGAEQLLELFKSENKCLTSFFDLQVQIPIKPTTCKGSISDLGQILGLSRRAIGRI